LYSKYIIKGVLEGFGGLKIWEKVRCTMTFSYWLRQKRCWRAWLIIDIGRCYGMEMKVKRIMIMRFTRQPSSKDIMIDYKQSENEKYFNSFVAR
jgi:hypothetical protein